MRLKTVACAGCAGALGLALAAALVHRPAAVVSSGRGPVPGHVKGAVHVHTAFSDDARGSVDDVARAARESGLGFVVITDHDRGRGPAGRAAAALSFEGYRQGVLVIAGLEKSTDGGHALVLGTGPLPFRLDGDPATVVRDAADAGGFVIAAHPTARSPEGRWTAGTQGVAGLEVMNLVEGLRPGSPLRWAPALLRYPMDPRGGLLRGLRYSRDALDSWDRALAERPMAGTVGSDAHGGFPVGPLFAPFPSHRAVFGLASQHLLLASALTGEAASDRRLVLDALRQGRGYVAVDGLADASVFRLEARSGGRSGGMGEAVPLEGEVELRAQADAPPGTTLVLLRDGSEIARGTGIVHVGRAPGAYRVEAFLDRRLTPAGGVPWILSNPVYVYGADRIAARAERARSLPPEDGPRPSHVEPVDAFEDPRPGPRWQIDRAPDASAAASIEGGALRFDYVLGPRPRTHASLCDWGRRDLTRHASVAFRVRADRKTRFDLQVRVDDAAAPGVRIWRRSVRAETAWRPVAVPLAALTTYDGRGGRPDLSRVRGIYFHVDESHFAPGSAGTLWIDDLGLGR